jgi:predicted nucleotidyltransferase
VSVLSEQQKGVVRRFKAACELDERVVAAFLGGSLAAGRADEWSDLDLYLITTDDTYNDFLDGREAFIRRLGEPLFLEDFDLPNTLFFILSDGTEGELAIGCESNFLDIHKGPYKVLLDKQGALAGATFQGTQPSRREQLKPLRRQIYAFWHDLSHFIVAMSRGQLWWAQGQLEALRRCCVALARLQQDPTAIDAVEDPYFKIDQAIPASAESLAPLQSTLYPMEPGAMLRAALTIVAYYQELAHMLAEKHGLTYPADLERIMLTRLERLRIQPESVAP